PVNYGDPSGLEEEENPYQPGTPQWAKWLDKHGGIHVGQSAAMNSTHEEAAVAAETFHGALGAASGFYAAEGIAQGYTDPTAPIKTVIDTAKEGYNALTNKNWWSDKTPEEKGAFWGSVFFAAMLGMAKAFQKGNCTSYSSFDSLKRANPNSPG